MLATVESVQLQSSLHSIEFPVESQRWVSDSHVDALLCRSISQHQCNWVCSTLKLYTKIWAALWSQSSSVVLSVFVTKLSIHTLSGIYPTMLSFCYVAYTFDHMTILFWSDPHNYWSSYQHTSSYLQQFGLYSTNLPPYHLLSAPTHSYHPTGFSSHGRFHSGITG